MTPSAVVADGRDAWFDPSPRVLARLSEKFPFHLKSPPPLASEGLLGEISRVRGIPESSLLLGSGGSSLLFTFLPRLVDPGATVVVLDPMCGEYFRLLENVIEAQVVRCRLDSELGFRVPAQELEGLCRGLEPDAVLLVNPNNPAGRLWPRQELLQWFAGVPESTLVVADETCIDFCGPGQSLEAETVSYPNLLVVKSMAKAYALNGLRAGYLAGHPATIQRLSLYQPPRPVGLLAQVAAIEALRDPVYYRDRWTETAVLRSQISENLARMGGYRVYPSEANYYLLECDDAPRVEAVLRSNSIFVRNCASMGSLDATRFLRIAVQDAGQNVRIEAALEQAR